MNKLLIFLLSLCVTSLEAATITNWGAQLPTAVPASGDVILMQKGGVTYYFTPSQLATQLSTNASMITGASSSNALYAIETTRNAAVSNALVTLIGSGGSTQLVALAVGTLTVTNALSVSILNANLLVITNGGIFTNVVNGFTNGSVTVGLLGLTNNGNVRVKGLMAGAGISLTDNGTNVSITAGVGGPGSVEVNLNQFATNSQINLKDGALATNLVVKAAGGATRALTVNTNGLVVDGGKVGIGTDSAVNMLDVEGGIAIGAGYSGAFTAPVDGAILQGGVGIGTASLGGSKLVVVAPNPGVPGFSGMSLLSGATNQYTSFSIGRIVPEHYFQMIAVNDDWLVGTRDGDMAFTHFGKFHFGSSFGGPAQVTFATDGFIGVNTVTPTNRVDVNGHASIRSNVFLGAITNVFTFGATNPPPASAVAPTKWISVRVAGESGLYRIPLYE